jgi:23S rRNA pseudouridine1911/1915/1917 synthase
MFQIRGKDAVTHIIKSKVNDEFCEIELELETGRTHQIRVHLDYIGLPIMGDPLYGNATLRDLQLFSYRIQFTHPILQKEIMVELDHDSL